MASVRNRAWLLLFAAVVGLMVAGVAQAGERVSHGTVSVEKRLLPNGAGCRAIWWIIVDDLPNVAEYAVTLNTGTVVRFTKYSNANSVKGTVFDYPAPAGKAHKYLYAGGTAAPCEDDAFTGNYSATSVKITQFSVDHPRPGKPAIEAYLTPTANGEGCSITLWASVPKIRGATAYRIKYVTASRGRNVVTRLRLTPRAFNSRPAGVKRYATRGDWATTSARRAPRATGARGRPGSTSAQAAAVPPCCRSPSRSPSRRRSESAVGRGHPSRNERRRTGTTRHQPTTPVPQTGWRTNPV